MVWMSCACTVRSLTPIIVSVSFPPLFPAVGGIPHAAGQGEGRRGYGIVVTVTPSLPAIAALRRWQAGRSPLKRGRIADVDALLVSGYDSAY